MSEGPKIVQLSATSDPNTDLIKQVERLLDQVKSGDVQALVMIKFKNDGGFAVQRIGRKSSIEVAGALAFAQYDVIRMNEPQDDH